MIAIDSQLATRSVPQRSVLRISRSRHRGLATLRLRVDELLSTILRAAQRIIEQQNRALDALGEAINDLSRHSGVPLARSLQRR